MLTAGVLGCGKSTTEYHLPALAALDGIEVAWVCDLDADRARAVGRAHDVPAFDDPAAAIANTPDVVHVNTPPSTHAELTVDALAAGAHVLVEKPMAMTAGECADMADAADREGRKLCVVHNNLFFDPMLAVVRAVDRGDYGDVVAVSSFLGGQPDPGDERGWVEASHAGPIGDRLPHPVYLATHFLEDPEPTAATIENDAGETRGVAVQLTDGDRVGSVQACEDAIPAKTATVVGERRRAVVDLFNYAAVEYRSVDRSPVAVVRDNVGAAAQLLAGTAENVYGYARDQAGEGSKFAAPGHYNLIAAFRDAIVADDPVPVPPAEGETTVRVLDAIDEATREAAAERPAASD